MSQFLDGLAHDLPGLLNEFGRIVDYTPAGGSTREVTVIVGQDAAPAELPNIQADGVRVWIRAVASHVSELAQGDAVSIGAVDYVVDGIEFDRGGTVMATLINAP